MGRAALTGLVLTACATARMAPPADVVDATEVFPVNDRSRASGALVNEGFALGSYTVADVDRDWDSKQGVGVGPWSKESKTSGFTYTLLAGSNKLRGKCASEAESQGIAALGGSFDWGSVTLACSCEAPGAKAELLISKEKNNLRVSDEQYKLAPINAVQGGGTQAKPAGFRADGDQVLGAVEVLHPGQVWLRKGLDDAAKSQAACLFVGLMLYKPPQD